MWNLCVELYRHFFCEYEFETIGAEGIVCGVVDVVAETVMRLVA